MNAPTAPKARKVWYWLKTNPRSTGVAVAAGLGASYKGVGATLSEMERKGEVSAGRVFSPTAGRYVREYSAVEAREDRT